MKPSILSRPALLLLFPLAVLAQGTFIYDQQSSVEGNYGSTTLGSIQGWQPMGQSFTPALDAVGFIRMVLNDTDPFDTSPGTIYINLHSGSITGPIMASTEPVQVPANTQGPINFYFAAPVPVTPGTSYYFQPWVESGSSGWGCNIGTFAYGGGIFNGGSSLPGYSLWFREGIVVPEPSAGFLLLLGLATAAWARRRSRSC